MSSLISSIASDAILTQAFTGLFYIRYRDDWVIIAPTRWKLRRAVHLVNETLARLRVEKHPDKTFVGRALRGFDFLGYHLLIWEITVAGGAVAKFKKRINRLYEQGAGIAGIGRYMKRWKQWAVAGIGVVAEGNPGIFKGKIKTAEPSSFYFVMLRECYAFFL